MVEKNNPRALAFYKKLGFMQEGIMRSAYKRSTDDHYTDELFLGKFLLNNGLKGALYVFKFRTQ